MMNQQTSYRLNYFLAALFVAFLLSGMIYLQLYKGFNPCALCILQRFVLGTLGVIFLIGAIVSGHRTARLSVGILAALSAFIGIIFAGRQVWLQHFPSSAHGNCEVSLSYMLGALPFDEVIKRVLTGGAECTEVGWEILGLSLAQWSLIGFIFFLLFSLWQLRSKSL